MFELHFIDLTTFILYRCQLLENGRRTGNQQRIPQTIMYWYFKGSNCPREAKNVKRLKGPFEVSNRPRCLFY